MKQITNFIKEGLRINKNTKLKKYKKSNYNPEPINGKNWIIDESYWNSGRFSFILDYAKQYLNENEGVLNENEIKFVKDLIDEMIFMKKYGFNYLTPQKKSNIINGNPPYFTNCKFIYDLVNWVLEFYNSDLTIPRKQKLNKILKEYEDTGILDDIKKLNWPVKDN